MSEVVRFPPLPPLPSPPVLEPDERQQTMRHVAENLADAFLASGGAVGVANTKTGFRASAVDLGQLQAIINDVLEPFDMNQVRERWNEDIFTWLRRFLMSWIQRCKEIHFDTTSERAIYIHLVTQDDHGYYTYEFDGFAGKRPRGRLQRTPEP